MYTAYVMENPPREEPDKIFWYILEIFWCLMKKIQIVDWAVVLKLNIYHLEPEHDDSFHTLFSWLQFSGRTITVEKGTWKQLSTSISGKMPHGKWSIDVFLSDFSWVKYKNNAPTPQPEVWFWCDHPQGWSPNFTWAVNKTLVTFH